MLFTVYYWGEYGKGSMGSQVDVRDPQRRGGVKGMSKARGKENSLKN